MKTANGLPGKVPKSEKVVNFAVDAGKNPEASGRPDKPAADKLVCWNCQKPGHLKKNCKQPQQLKSGYTKAGVKAVW